LKCLKFELTQVP